MASRDKESLVVERALRLFRKSGLTPTRQMRAARYVSERIAEDWQEEHAVEGNEEKGHDLAIQERIG